MIESYKIGRFWNIHFPSVMKITEIEKWKIKCFQWHTWRWSWLNLTKLEDFEILIFSSDENHWNRKTENKMFSMTYLKMNMIESYKIGINVLNEILEYDPD